LTISLHARVQAAFWLSRLHRHAKSAIGAPRQALADPDERVRKAAEFALTKLERE
jgi:hypothetical protein